MSLLPGFHVNPHPSRDRDLARKTTDGSGAKSLELYEMHDPHGSSLRTCLDYLLSKTGWYSSAVWLTWKVSTTRYNRLLFRLAPSMPSTGATGFGLWLTPEVPNGGMGMPKGISPTGKTPDGKKRQVGLHNQVKMVEAKLWPTPKGSAAGADFAKLDRSKTGISLQTAVSLWPTPHGFSPDGKSNGPSGNELGRAVNQSMYPTPASREQIPNAVGGSLNPDWVEWLMGFPVGYTDLED